MGMYICMYVVQACIQGRQRRCAKVLSDFCLCGCGCVCCLYQPWTYLLVSTSNQRRLDTYSQYDKDRDIIHRKGNQFDAY